MSRAVLLVLDGLGVGEMPDVKEGRPEDIGANTLAHLLEQQPVEIPVLSRLGLGHILNRPDLLPLLGPLADYGVCQLLHDGADTYAGHNEIMGARPKAPMKTLIREASKSIEDALVREGYHVSYPLGGTEIILVDGKIIVADNMETDPGQIINVTGPLDEVPFEKIYHIGLVVRGIVKTSRVIALGGTNVTPAHIIASCLRRGNLAGVDTPSLNIYNEGYQVRHLGYGVNPDGQISTILGTSSIPAYLYGKIADVIQGEVRERDPVVATNRVFERITSRLKSLKHGFIGATVQETDLAGHEEDCAKYAEILRISDKGIGAIIDLLQEGDLLIITADHGNDPTIGHSRHTREQTPLLVYRKGQTVGKNLGVRETLADVAATIADFFDVRPTESGSSAIRK
jgi:phosphopentomutase